MESWRVIVQQHRKNKRRVARSALLAATVVLLSAVSLSAQVPSGREGPEYYWPQWRGPLGTGVAPRAEPPVEWSDRKNIRWKISLPGSGHLGHNNRYVRLARRSVRTRGMHTKN